MLKTNLESFSRFQICIKETIERLWKWNSLRVISSAVFTLHITAHYLLSNSRNRLGLQTQIIFCCCIIRSSINYSNSDRLSKMTSQWKETDLSFDLDVILAFIFMRVILLAVQHYFKVSCEMLGKTIKSKITLTVSDANNHRFSCKHSKKTTGMNIFKNWNNRL